MLIRLSYCNNSIRFVAQVFALAPRFFFKKFFELFGGFKNNAYLCNA